MNKQIYILFLLVLLCSASLLAQNHTAQNGEVDDDPYESKSFFMVGVNYLSDNVYLGRKDSLIIPYYSPYIGYHFDNGIYFKGILSYTTTKGTHIDLATLEAGYDHDFGKYFSGGAYAERYFYNKNSVSIRSNMKALAGIYGQFDNKIIEPRIIINLVQNNNSSDYVLGLNLDHDFKLMNNTMHILPTVSFMYGTQNYYDEYFTNRINKRKAKKDKPAKAIVADPNDIVPLVYELSIKCTYMVNKWLFTLEPKYAIPLSPATITINKTTSHEKLSNTFYLELDICHR